MAYSLAVWGNVAKVHINRIITLQKQEIRLVHRIKRLDRVAPIAYENSILLLPELYEMSLSCSFFRCYNIHYIASLFVSLFVSQGIIPRSGLSATIIPRSGLSATSARNSQYYLYLPYVCMSLCKINIVYQSIAL